MILQEDFEQQNYYSNEIQQKQSLIDDSIQQIGYLTKGQRMIFLSARPSFDTSPNSNKQFQIKNNLKRKIQKTSKQTSSEKAIFNNGIFSQSDNNSSHQSNGNYVRNQSEQSQNQESLYEVQPSLSSRLISYKVRGLSLSSNKQNQSCDYIITPKSKRRRSTNQSINSNSQYLSSSESNESLSTAAYINTLSSESVSQEKDKYKDIILKRMHLNDQYNQLTLKKEKVKNINSINHQKDSQLLSNHFEFGDKLNNKFDCLISPFDQETQSVQMLEDKSISKLSQISQTLIKSDVYTNEANNKNNPSLHNYFKFLFNKPQKGDLNLIQDQEKTPKSEKIKGRKPYRFNTIQPPLTKQQKQQIIEEQLQQIKIKQQSEIKQFKISVNRCLEKFKYQYRVKQVQNLQSKSETQNEQNQMQTYNEEANQSQSQQKQYRKISYQGFENERKMNDSPVLPVLKKGTSYISTTPDITCESPLTAKMKKQLAQNNEPHTNKSTNKKQNCITIHASPFQLIKMRRSNINYDVQNKTLDYTDTTIKSNQFREKTTQQVGEMAKYDFSCISRSPCQLRKYPKIKQDTTEQRFQEIMKTDKIQKQFEDIYKIIETSTQKSTQDK